MGGDDSKCVEIIVAGKNIPYVQQQIIIEVHNRRLLCLADDRIPDA